MSTFKSFRFSVLMFSVFVFVACHAMAQPIRVGVYRDRRAKAVEEITKTLNAEDGITAEIIESGTRRDPLDYSVFHNYDVIYFGGGNIAMDWLGIQARMHLLELVEQRGGGVIFSMFRCGSSFRGRIRPLFPQIANGIRKVNSRGMFVVAQEHPIMEGLPEQFLNSYWDQMALDLGLEGIPLAVNSGGVPVIACGSSGDGRVVFVGTWLGINIRGSDIYPIPEIDRTLLFNSVRWAAGSGRRDRSEFTELSEITQLKVLRSEITRDWTHDESGMSFRPGVMVEARNLAEQDLDNLIFRLERYTEMVSENPDTALKALRLRNELAVLLSELDSRYREAVALKKLEISGMSLDELKADETRSIVRFQPGTRFKLRDELVDSLRREFLPDRRLRSVSEGVREIEEEFEPKLQRAMAAKFAAERAEDARSVRGLISELDSPDPSVRAAAALELGRIGDSGRNTVRALVRVLADDDYTTRRNAIYALSWMQERNAVPDLVNLLRTHEDPLTRRRAAQGLGQIGDPRAVEALVEALEDDDIQTQHNAMLSLGWIGDKKAVEPLVAVARANLEDGDRRTFSSAVMALGYIGDESALPFLEDEETGEKDAVRLRGRVEVDFVQEAIYLIKKGGRGERGIRQLDEMRARNHFYWMTGRFNALFGRYTSYRAKTEPKNPDYMLSYAASSGGTGTVEFNTFARWIDRQPEIEIDRHFELATKLGLKINTQWPTFPTSAYIALYEREIERLGGHPSFGGLWFEENVSLSGHSRGRGDEGLQEYMLSKYTPEELAEIGVEDISQVAIPTPDGPDSGWRRYHQDGARTNKVVFAEFAEMAADFGLDSWRESQEWVAQRRMGAKSSFSMSRRYMQGGSTFISGYARINQALDAGGPQSYCEHSSMNNFHLDLHVDGESRPAQGEFYAMDAGSVGRIERGFASSFLYGQQFFNWSWHHITKHPHQGCMFDGPGRWEAAVRQFSKGSALSEYLAPGATKGAGLLTQLYSGRTTTLTYGGELLDGTGGGGRHSEEHPTGYPYRYTQDQQAFWEALIRSHLPVEMTWLETQHPDKLAGYKVAVLANSPTISRDEAEMLREWVRNGGTLIATASSTLHDQWDRLQENYSLADVFGVDFVRRVQEPSLVYIERDIKPATGIVEIRMTDQEYFLHMEGAVSAEYEKDTGYDIVEPTTARVVGVWEDDSPAVFENSYGKGHAIFIAARYPALSHLTKDWTAYDLYKEYWPGMRELLAACVKRGLDLAGAELPVIVENCPQTVDFALKRQEQNNRWMTHLLNMDDKNGLIREVKMTVKPPHPVKSVYYAYPEREEVEYVEVDGAIEFVVRPFDVHEMVVIEWE